MEAGGHKKTEWASTLSILLWLFLFNVEQYAVYSMCLSVCVFCLNGCQRAPPPTPHPPVLSVKPNPPSGCAQVTALLSGDTLTHVCFSHRSHTACFYVFLLSLSRAPLHHSFWFICMFPCFFISLSVQIPCLFSPFPRLHFFWMFLSCQLPTLCFIVRASSVSICPLFPLPCLCRVHAVLLSPSCILWPSFSLPECYLPNLGTLIVFVNNDISLPQVAAPLLHWVCGSHYLVVPLQCRGLDCSSWSFLGLLYHKIGLFAWFHQGKCCSDLQCLLYVTGRWCHIVSCVLEKLITEDYNNSFSVCHMTFFSLPLGSSKVYPFVTPSCIIQIWLQRSGFLSKTCRF